MEHLARCVAAALLLTLGFGPARGLAWKPYTHNFTGKQVLLGLDCAAGTVRVEGAAYRVIPQVAAAICAQRESYQAGLTGPDGFPDLAYGQAVIHPADTGKWLSYLLSAAWTAQGDPGTSTADKQRILAFTYGFLTHAAGDVWGHTLVNEFAQGVFPSVAEVVADPAGNLPLALRHVIVEGVVGDATPGFDGNPTERKPAPGGYGAVGGDRSTDATDGYQYDIPHAFLTATLVSPSAPTPVLAQRGTYVAARGPLIGEFLELRDQLREFAGEPGPVAPAAAAYLERMATLRSIQETCVSSCFLGLFKNFRACADEVGKLGLTLGDLSREGLEALVEHERDRLGGRVLRAYLLRWADQIDAGLAQWTHLGLATTQALFDAQTHRAEQNAACQELGVPEDAANEQLRSACEGRVTIGEAVRRRSQGFIQQHGTRMLGLPDEAAEVYLILKQQEQRLLEVLAAMGSPLRPLAEEALKVKVRFDELVNQAVSDVLGIDIDRLESMLRGPATWMCAAEIEVGFRGATVKVPLFAPGDRARLDARLGLDDSSHVAVPGVPAGCGRLKDDATLAPDSVPAIRNTILMGKLLLLEPAELNRLLGLTLAAGGAPVVAYQAGDNVMTTSLGAGDPWLRLIDGDHAWRRDGRPIFAARPDEKTGGTGRFPVWESCTLRSAFRRLFRDWENPPGGSFPALGDASTPDPANPGLPCIETSAPVPLLLAAPAPARTRVVRPVPGRMVGSDAAPDQRVLDKYDANRNKILDPEELARLRADLLKMR